MGRAAKNYPRELKDRAMARVREVRPDYPSEYAAIEPVAAKLGIGTPETLRKWIRQAEINSGARQGVTSEESAEVRKLRAENRELRRANEILKAASIFFAAERDHDVARCTVERLMRALGPRGTSRGKVKRTTIADPAAARAGDPAECMPHSSSTLMRGAS